MIPPTPNRSGHPMKSAVIGLLLIGAWLFPNCIATALAPTAASATWTATTLVAPTLIAPTEPRRAPAAKTIQFGGYTWEVRSGTGGPGPNIWDDANAWLDATGALHLTLTHVGSAWHCVEIVTTQRLGYGTYQFDVTGRIDQLDRNVVFGLFNYPTPDVGPDETNEIDIEMARWGKAADPNGNYTVWPAQPGVNRTYKTFEFSLTGDKTTQRFTWMPQSVDFASAPGSASDNQTPYAAWNDQPAASGQYIPQKAVPLHMNLWLFQGNAPTNQQEVELVVKRFTFTPATQVFLPALFDPVLPISAVGNSRALDAPGKP
jgi:hypothetical protein